MIDLTLIVPCYNGARFIAAAIDSIVGQRYDALEIVDLLIDGYLEHKWDEVAVVYNEFRNTIAQNRIIEPFLPLPVVGYDGDEYYWITEDVRPQSMGRLSAFMSNAGVLMRAYIYARMLGREGMHRVADYATLNANYLMAKLRDAGFELAFPDRRASHEFIVTLKKQAKELDVTAMDFAKRLLDYGYHAPTTYFPLLIPECLLIEPTETESREELDGFVEAMIKIQQEAERNPALLHEAPHTQPVRRLDEVRAARELDLRWTG